MAVAKAEYLQDVLTSHKMVHIDGLLTKYKAKRDEVKEALVEKYAGDIYTPMNSGSYAKHTAINSKFDLDVIIPFKRNSFDTLKMLFEDVYEFLLEKYEESGKGIVRKQKVSVGINFHADNDGDIVKLDIVPGRELSQDDYNVTKDLNLRFNEKTGLLAENSYIKTNIQEQIDYIRNTGDERHSVRQIIRLFKIWKHTNGEKYKSFLLELITIKAFNKVDISGNLWEKLKLVMEYIKNNVTNEDFKLIDPGNSNNDVIKSLEPWERTSLSNRMDTMIKRIEENSENIKTYFPINEQFENKKASPSSYKIKGPEILPSIPANNQRYGKWI